jgi:membrane protease YdiL (CAAX protease family)|tara:strand:+ start:185 stop:628 length:444 start_codon:yes stop_codon:yes gene_type:complete
VKHPYLTALLGGATISLLPTWLVAQIAARVPELAPQELEIVSEFFDKGFGAPQMLVFFIIITILPMLEEWLFRGVLWRAVSKIVPLNFTLIITSLIFAMAHWEVLHVLGLLPLSFFLGWLRLKTGELGPSMVAHTTNNLVACLLMFL